MKINLGSEITSFVVSAKKEGSIEDAVLRVAEGIQRLGFPDFVEATQERVIGWSSFDDFLDSKWEFSTIDKGPYLFFNLRIDSKKVSGKALKRLFAEYEKKNGPVKGKAKREAKDNIKYKLLINAPVVTQCVPVVMDATNGSMVLFSSSPKIIEEFIVLFEASATDVQLDYDKFHDEEDSLSLLTKMWVDLARGRKLSASFEENDFDVYLGNSVIAESAENKISVSGDGDVVEEIEKALENGFKISKCAFVLEPSETSQYQAIRFSLGSTPSALSRLKFSVSSGEEAPDVDGSEDLEMEAMCFEYAHQIMMIKNLVKSFVNNFI